MLLHQSLHDKVVLEPAEDVRDFLRFRVVPVKEGDRPAAAAVDGRLDDQMLLLLTDADCLLKRDRPVSVAVEIIAGNVLGYGLGLFDVGKNAAVHALVPVCLVDRDVVEVGVIISRHVRQPVVGYLFYVFAAQKYAFLPICANFRLIISTVT